MKTVRLTLDMILDENEINEAELDDARKKAQSEEKSMRNQDLARRLGEEVFEAYLRDPYTEFVMDDMEYDYFEMNVKTKFLNYLKKRTGIGTLEVLRRPAKYHIGFRGSLGSNGLRIHFEDCKFRIVNYLEEFTKES